MHRLCGEKKEKWFYAFSPVCVCGKTKCGNMIHIKIEKKTSIKILQFFFVYHVRSIREIASLQLFEFSEFSPFFQNHLRDDCVLLILREKKNIFSFQSFPEKIDYFGFSKKWLNEMCKNKESVVPDQSVIFEKFKSWRQRDEFVRENACRELSI